MIGRNDRDRKGGGDEKMKGGGDSLRELVASAEKKPTLMQNPSPMSLYLSSPLLRTLKKKRGR